MGEVPPCTKPVPGSWFLEPGPRLPTRGTLASFPDYYLPLGTYGYASIRHNIPRIRNNPPKKAQEVLVSDSGNNHSLHPGPPLQTAWKLGGHVQHCYQPVNVSLAWVARPVHTFLGGCPLGVVSILTYSLPVPWLTTVWHPRLVSLPSLASFFFLARLIRHPWSSVFHGSSSTHHKLYLVLKGIVISPLRRNIFLDHSVSSRTLLRPVKPGKLILLYYLLRTTLLSFSVSGSQYYPSSLHRL